ncbi:MAG: lysozyme family protein [Phenylobacterium sp.]|nr:lysozyme family protein [Phenylobacterium sp.]
MKPRHRVSRAAIELITRFEGYRRKAAQLPDGRWMIGYGHTLTAREGAEVTEEDAEALLLYDLIAVSHAVNEWSYAPLTQNQFDALASFAFNIGLENFRRSSVLKRINEGALIQAACAMELWRKAEFGGERIVIDALVRRRASEKALFLTPPDGWPTAPTPILRPLLDADAEGLVPREPPAPVTASLDGEEVRVLRADEPTPPPVPPEDEGLSPVQAAAEAVAARLQTIFADEPQGEPPEELTEPEIVSEPAPDELAAEPDLPMPTAEPEAGFELASPAEAEEPRPPLFAETAEPEAEGPLSGELFAANDAETAVQADDDAPPVAAFAPAGERKLIDDTAPFEFTAPAVQPLRKESRGGPFSLVLLAVIGLAFFGGGVFWALNARGAIGGGMVTPLLVGWLAGIAGVGLFSVAVFLLLQRLGRPDSQPGRHQR